MDTIENNLAAIRPILESLTPAELTLEYTRVFHSPPPEGLASESFIEPILAKIRHDLQTAAIPFHPNSRSYSSLTP
jgi:hypothetical protein